MSLVKGYNNDRMSALERILAVVTGKIPDRVPIFPMIDSIPADLFHMPIQKYFSHYNYVLNGQKKLQELLNLDYVLSFYYLAIESEIFGMNSIFFETGSPNTGEPIAKSIEFFKNNEVPDLISHPIYQKTISLTKALAKEFKGKKPILEVQTGPFSFPSLLMGANLWFDSILMYPSHMNNILNFAMEFEEQWAKGHIENGADVVVLVDGLATATSIPKDMFENIIIPLYKKYTKNIKAPVLFYTAGGDILPFADVLEKIGVIGVFPSSNDDLEEFKRISNGKYTLFGNLNNLEFGDWTSTFMEQIIKTTFNYGKPNGNFALATQHMIPHNTPIEKIAKFISIALKYAYY